MDVEDPNDPPPSYDSLFGKLKQAKEENQGDKLSFFRQICTIFTSGVGFTIGLAIATAVPIAMIVIGGIHLYDCPAQRFIPIYLIVMGAFSILRTVSSLLQRCLNHTREQNEDNTKSNPFDVVIGCFIVAWFIAGNVWIYGLYGNLDVTWQTSDPSPTADPLLVPTEAPLLYCNATLYWFSFWITTIGYIMIMLGCCCCCVAIVVAALMA